MSSGHSGAVKIEQRIEAPADMVAGYISDFRNAKEWMVGVESVVPLGDDSYRLALDSPIGRIETRGKDRRARPGEHHLGLHLDHRGRRSGRRRARRKRGLRRLLHRRVPPQAQLLDKAARFVGAERFARSNGERSLSRLKHLMEARRQA